MTSPHFSTPDSLSNVDSKVSRVNEVTPHQPPDSVSIVDSKVSRVNDVTPLQHTRLSK